MKSEDYTQRQFEVAETILDCIYDSIKEKLEKGDVVTVDQLDEAYRKVKQVWPNIYPVFEKNCRDCLEKAVGRFNPDTRRKDYFSRLVLSKISILHPKRDMVLDNLSFVQVVAPGIRQNLHSVYSQTEFRAMNEQALQVFALARTDDDGAFWQIATENPEIMLQADRILIHYLLRFRPFNFHRENFTSTMRRAIANNAMRFGEDEFYIMFDCLFGEYFDYVSDHKKQTMLNLQFGYESSERLASIFMAYQRMQQTSRPAFVQHQAALAATRQLWL